MSHFFTVVIVPGATPPDQIEETVTRLLAPYDEKLAVVPYKVYLDQENIEHMASHYKTSADDLAALARHMRNWCGNEGGVDERGLYRLSTYNPQSKWDWWVIGGRWNGKVRSAPRNDETGFNFGSEYHQLPENMLPVKELQTPLSCFALVTPDGVWHEQGEMGMFGMVANEKEEEVWQREVAEILQKHQSDILVGVDCHI
jgi:hypothetical protein